MRRRKRHPSHANHERWLVSYADFITLLFAFFVVLYASSQVDKRKVGKLAVAIQTAFQEMGIFQSSGQAPIDPTRAIPFNIAQALDNVEPTASSGPVSPRTQGTLTSSPEDGELAKLQDELQTMLAPEIQRSEIAIRNQPDGFVISLREAGFFESGSAQMKTTSQAAFDRIAAMLRDRNYRLRIEGHTDNVPIHTAQFPSNWELSSSRATEVVRLLIVRNGFNPDRLSAGGFAEFHPAASNRTPEGRGVNRRVDMVILGTPVLAVAAPALAAAPPPPAATSIAQPPALPPAKPTAPNNPRQRLQQ